MMPPQRRVETTSRGAVERVCAADGRKKVSGRLATCEAHTVIGVLKSGKVSARECVVNIATQE